LILEELWSDPAFVILTCFGIEVHDRVPTLILRVSDQVIPLNNKYIFGAAVSVWSGVEIKPSFPLNDVTTPGIEGCLLSLSKLI
jgi:hypothetical protein